MRFWKHYHSFSSLMIAQPVDDQQSRSKQSWSAQACRSWCVYRGRYTFTDQMLFQYSAEFELRRMYFYHLSRENDSSVAHHWMRLLFQRQILSESAQDSAASGPFSAPRRKRIPDKLALYTKPVQDRMSRCASQPESAGSFSSRSFRDIQACGIVFA